MATFLQNTVNGTATGVSSVLLTYGSNCTPGSTLFCSVTNVTNVTPPVVSDPTNGTWVLLNGESRSTTDYTAHFAVYNTSSSALVVTITDGGVSNTRYGSIYEISGLVTGWTTSGQIVDNSGATNSGSNGTSTSGSQPSVTTSSANSLVITTQGGHSTTITSPAVANGSTSIGTYSLQQSAVSGGIRMFDASAQLSGTNATGENPYFTWTTSVGWSQLTTALITVSTSSHNLTLLGAGS